MADGRDANAAEGAVRRLRQTSADLRECAILGPDGEVLAASSDAEWAARTAELLVAVEDPARPAPSQVHVAVEAGEVFLLCSPEGDAVVAVSDRFALASLMFCDLRAALRELDAGLGAAA